MRRRIPVLAIMQQDEKNQLEKLVNGGDLS